MYCKYCGKDIPENSKFCRHCGNKLSTEPKTESLEIDDRINDKSSEKVKYAGFWVRLGAYVIDFLGMMVGAFVLGLFISSILGENIVNALPDVFWNYFSYVIYSTFALSVWSTTLGKHLYGLKVVKEDKEDLDFGRSLKRSLLQPLSTIFFGIGYWDMNKNTKKQAWHDKVSGTAVVRRKRSLALAYLVTVVAAIIWAYLSYGLEQ